MCWWGQTVETLWAWHVQRGHPLDVVAAANHEMVQGKARGWPPVLRDCADRHGCEAESTVQQVGGAGTQEGRLRPSC